MEGILARYLSIFLPFLATVVLAHLVLRSSGSWQTERIGLASPALLRRILLATASAIGIILVVDLVTGGDLVLRPSSPRSEILIALVLVTLVAARSILRIAERLMARGQSSAG
ncbi:MAG: hypothetical protein KGK34_00355 [Chloroflexota bacterium]|nr:hypothetical protein [Chloroflexota bacterium]